jgi:hypothetical protein
MHKSGWKSPAAATPAASRKLPHFAHAAKPTAGTACYAASSSCIDKSDLLGSIRSEVPRKDETFLPTPRGGH